MPRITPQLFFLALIGSLCVIQLLILPAMIGAIIDHFGLSPGAAGWSASLNFMGGAASAITLSLFVHRLPLQRVAASGLLLAAGADLVSACVGGQSVPLYMAIRVLAGIGAGGAYASVMSTLARRPDASKGYGLLMTLQFLLSAVGLYGIPLLLPVTGVRGLFVGIGVIELVAAVTMGLISLAPVIGAQVTHAGTELKVLLNRVALFSIIGGGLYEASNTAQFTYAERMGVAINLGGDTIGPVLGTASLMGIPGALCIVWIGDRVRSITMVQLGIAGTLAGLLLLMVATNLTLYTISMCLLGFSWAFTLPYFQTIQAGMDPRGSVVAAGAFATMIGDTLAPGAAASVLSGDDYTRVLSLSIILSGLAAVLIRKKTS